MERFSSPIDVQQEPFAISAPEQIDPTIADCPVPSPEETLLHYKAAVETYDVSLGPHPDLGDALTTFPPATELIIRGRFGLFPFSEPQTNQQIADRLEVLRASVASRFSNVSKVLSSGEYSTWRGISGTARLEDIARAVPGDESDGLTDAELQFLRELRGIAPFSKPTSLEDMAVKYAIGKHTIRKRVTSMTRVINGVPGALDELRGRTHKNSTQAIMSEERAQRLRGQLRKRDAGVYASMLYHLATAPPGVRGAWQDILQRDFERASELRAQRLRRSANQKQQVLQVLNSGKYSPSSASTINQKREFNPVLDTEDGRMQVISSLVRRAIDLSKEDVEDLPVIIEEGKDAERAAHADNTDLVEYTARRLGKVPPNSKKETENEELWNELGAAGSEGLMHAIRRFDPEVGIKFSTYAVKVIGGYMLRRLTHLQVSSGGMSQETFWGIHAVRKAEQSIVQEYGGNPTKAELEQLLAEKLGMDPARVRKYRAERVQIRPLSLDRSRAFDSDPNSGTLHEQIATPLLPADHEKGEALREAFIETLRALDISDEDADIFFKLSGIGGKKFTLRELAQEKNKSHETVRTRAKRVKELLSESAYAQKTLLRFVNQDTDSESAS